LQKTKNYPKRNSATQLQRAARERADDQARRIPWQRLYDARNQYIDWHEFYLWVRSILEVEGRIPGWLVEILNARCPGFIETERALTPKAAKSRPLHFRLEDWIEDHVFGFAKQEGWFNAITFYAARDPRYQRAEVCWSDARPLEKLGISPAGSDARKASRGLRERRRVKRCDANVSLEISHIKRKDVLDCMDVHGSNKTGIINFDALDFVVAYNRFPSGVNRRNVRQQS
jgi:hypothetical protein